ncbi:response regulator transcription factor [Streptomyces violaceusniger]|uniref:Two component transcriptional regulator, winged helix family n=1 Tax=Streptomyces violaceusniger (strain Tu 4113) TaxID=653045 RepID=G2NSU6_STRV4|nr:response regulator transcription factor [Streptomyces violaceusniger]AEM81135.1 two component transcriptional regulator, winged helix family [Streptomyces violaceusniger Tu 4113]
MRILVIEDDEALGASLTWGLKAEGYVVCLTADGAEGLWLAQEHDFDLIVLDVMLPGLDGYQICARLREAGKWTPILMLTAMDAPLDQAEGLDLGADDYLTKPFSYPVLLAHLRALLRRSTRERPAQLRSGELTLDPATHAVHFAGRPLALTPGEASVLEYLLRAEGRTVSKAELLEHCWDMASRADPAVVEVRIHHLRRKTDASVIETVRGRGYRIDPHRP